MLSLSEFAMDVKFIEQTSKRYCKYGIWLTAALTLLAIGAIGLNWIDMAFLNAIVVSAVYSLVVIFAYCASWKWIAKTSSVNMAKFYLAASAIRLMTAALVVVAYCILSQDKVSIRYFVLLFFAYYVMMLVFDSVFFARVEKCNNQKFER